MLAAPSHDAVPEAVQRFFARCSSLAKFPTGRGKTSRHGKISAVIAMLNPIDDTELHDQIIKDIYKNPEAKERYKGRPPSTNKKILKALTLCARAGLTDEEMAAVIRVSVSTFKRWKHKSKGFQELLAKAKTEADSKVVTSLFERATGYTHPDEKIFLHEGEVVRAATTKHYPPDPVSAIFWLKNRRPHEWRDRVEHTGADGERLGHLTQNVLMIQTDPTEAVKVYTDLMSHAPRALPAPDKNVTDVEDEFDPADEFL